VLADKGYHTGAELKVKLLQIKTKKAATVVTAFKSFNMMFTVNSSKTS